MGLSWGSSMRKDFWQPGAKNAISSNREQKRIRARPANALARSFSRESVNRIWRLSRVIVLIHDLETVFLDDRIGEDILGNTLELLLRFFAVPAIQIEDEKLALAYAGNLRVAQAEKGVLNGLTLRVQNSAFRHNPDVSFHGHQYSNSCKSVHAGLGDSSASDLD